MPREQPSEAAADQGHERPAQDRGAVGLGRCTWTTHGRQCYLVGDSTPDIGSTARRYCHWHLVSLRDPRYADDYEEFCRWLAGWRRACVVENHYPARVVWAALQGEAPIHAIDPQWCGLVFCKHFPIDLTAKWIQAGRGLPPGPFEAEQFRLRTKPVSCLVVPEPPEVLEKRRALVAADLPAPAPEEAPL